MSRKLPAKDEVLEAILHVFTEKGIVNSQTKFRELVVSSLKAQDERFVATGARVRRIALESGKVSVEVRTREVNRRNPSKCPVCGGKLVPQKNKTVYNGTVTLGYQCSNCPYWTGLKYRRPIRYVFVKK